MKITTTIKLEEHPLALKHGEFRIVVELDEEAPQIFSGAFPLFYNAQDAIDKHESICSALKEANWVTVAHLLHSIYESQRREAEQVKP